MFCICVLGCWPSGDARYKLGHRKRSQAQCKSILDALQAWQLGGPHRDQLVRDVLRAAYNAEEKSRSAVSSDAAKQRRCIKLVKEHGQFRKAIQALLSYGVAVCDERTIQELRDKHPEGPLPTCTLPDNLSQDDLDFFQSDDRAAVVLEALHSFPKGTACGRSGMRVTHLLEMSQALGDDKQFITSLTEVVDILASGWAPKELAPIIASAPLVPILKKGGGIRPVAVGEVLRRLVSKIGLRGVAQDAAKYLSPEQVGVGVSHAAEATLHAFNRLLQEPDFLSEDTTFAAVDIENAFNSVLRQAFMDELVAHFPALAKWVYYTYGCAALVFAGAETILATSGVQQGDPLGPLLFALALQPLLTELKMLGCSISPTPSLPAVEAAAPRTDRLQLVAFLDDITIAAPTADLAVQALRTLHSSAEAIGLTVSKKKSLVWQPHRQIPNQQLQDSIKGLAVYHQDTGIPLLGGSVTRDVQYAAAVAMERAEKCIEGIKKLRGLDDPQVCLLLLRACLGMPKLNYCWRTTPTEALHKATAAVDKALTEALRHIVGQDLAERFGSFQDDLSSLPLHLGGLGITRAKDIICYTYLASMLDTHKLQRTLIDVLPDNAPRLRGELDRFMAHFKASPETSRTQSNQLSAAARTTAPPPPPPPPPPAQALTANNNPLPSSKNQHSLATVYYKHKRQCLLSDDYLQQDSFAEFRSQHSLILEANAVSSKSKSKSLASQWLMALPNPGIGQAMTPAEMRAALCYRLLMPIASRKRTCPHGSCGHDMDIFGYHALSCEGAGGHLTARHAVVQNALCGLAQYCGFHPRKEAVTVVWQDSQGRLKHLRPADLLVDGDSFDRKLCIDVTIVSPLSEARAKKPEGRLGKLVDQAAKNKINKHQEACVAAGYDFEPFAVDVCGVVDGAAASLLKRFSSRQAGRTRRAYSYVLSLSRRRISTALHIGIARQFLSAVQPHTPASQDSDTCTLSTCFQHALQLNDGDDVSIPSAFFEEAGGEEDNTPGEEEALEGGAV
jgi:hypothetical protein